MAGRVILVASLCLNAVLALLLWQTIRFDRDSVPPKPSGLVEVPSGYKTNVVVRRQAFTWQEIESADYPTYIANLRSINCPEVTIRDIIVADVNELFARRRADVELPVQKWWKSEPDTPALAAAASKLEALEAERRALLDQLLGPNWDVSLASSPDVEGLTLDGPVLGALSAEVKGRLQEIEARARQQQNEYLESRAKAGLAANPADLARLRKETRDELSKVLTPPQLEEYLLRHSHTAQTMRREFRGLQLTPEEFRSIFRIRDPVDQQIDLYYGRTDGGVQSQRADLVAQRDAAVKQALGPERANLFEYLQNPIFRQVQTATEGIGAPAEAVLPLFQITQMTQSERERIRNNGNLSPEEQAAAIEAVLTEYHRSLRKILGDAAYEHYRQGQGL